MPQLLCLLYLGAILVILQGIVITEENIYIILKERCLEFFSSMNSLEFIATQYDAFLKMVTIFDLPKILQEITL